MSRYTPIQSAGIAGLWVFCIGLITTFPTLGFPTHLSAQSDSAPSDSAQSDKVATKAEALLRWKNGDVLSGELLQSEGSLLRWRSPLFDGVFSLRIDALDRVEFPGSEQVIRTGEPVRLQTRSGDVLFGKIDQINDQHVLLSSDRHGQIKIARDGVYSLRRMNNPALIYLGPSGKAGWKSLKSKRGMRAWELTIEGQLTTKKSEATLYREIELSDGVEIELSIAWQGDPDFKIALGAPRNKAALSELVQIETWSDEVVIYHDEGDFEPVVTLGPEQKNLKLRLYWDRKQGKLAVYSDGGKLLTQIDASAEHKKTKPGIYFENKEGSLTLSSLRIGKWTGQLPKEMRPGESRVHLVDGGIRYGEIRSFDVDKQVIVFSAAEQGETEIAMDQVDSVYMTGPTEAGAESSDVQLRYHDGALISGTLQSIDDSQMTIDSTYSDQPIVSNLHGAAVIRMNRPAANVESDVHVLHFDAGKLQGRVVGGTGQPGDVLRWKPVGSENSVALSTDCDARIVLQGKRNRDDSVINNANFADTLYLTNRDVIPCRILAIDEEWVHIQSFAEKTKVPHEMVKAVELAETGQIAAVGFKDESWVVNEKKQGTVRRTKREAVFAGPARMAHNTFLSAGNLQFEMEWGKNQDFAQMTMMLFEADAEKPTGKIRLSMFIQGRQIHIGSGTGFGFDGSHSTRVKGNKAKFSLVTDGETLFLDIDGKRVFSQKLDPNDINGRGVVFSTEPSGIFGGEIEPASRVVVRDLVAVRTEGRANSIIVDPEKKQLVLTIPRNRKKNPPTHILCAKNGDMLRGRLAELIDDRVKFVSRMEDFTFPRNRLASIVWLHHNYNEKKEPAQAADPPAAEGGQKQLVQAVLHEGLRVTLNAEGWSADLLAGQSEYLGHCDVPAKEIRELRLGRFANQAGDVPYADWVPEAAVEPKLVSGGGGDDHGHPHAGGFGTESPLVGTQAKNFKIDQLDGKPFDLSQYRGKVVVLDFWATWCGPCIQALPQVTAAVNSFDSDQVVFLAVNQQEEAEMVKEFAQRQGFDFDIGLDKDGSVGNAFNVSAIPQTVVIDQEGKIARLHVGGSANLEQELKEAIQQVLSGEAPPTGQPAESTNLVDLEAHSFDLKLLDGSNLKLDPDSDQVLILDFWATWCGPCVRAMPKMIEMASEFPKDKVRLVAVNQAEEEQMAREFVENQGWQLTVALDPEAAVGERYGASALPHTVIIYKGRIRWQHTGASSTLQDEIQTVVQKLLDQQ